MKAPATGRARGARSARVVRAPLALGVALATLAGCRGDPTSVVVTARTNLSALTEVDEIVIEVTGAPTDQPASFGFKIKLPSDLPVVLGLYPSRDPYDQLDVRATARSCGEVRVDRRMATAFVPDHVERLTMDLDSLCHGCPSYGLCDDLSGKCPDPDGGTTAPDACP